MERRQWLTAAICAGFIMMQVYLDLRIPDYMGNMTEAIQAGAPTSEIYAHGIEMIVCAVLSLIVALSASFFAVRTSTAFCASLRDRIFKKVSRFTPGDVGNFSVDSLITRSTNDVAQVQNFIAQALQVMVKTPILVIWALVKISGSEWEWTAATAAGVVIITVLLAMVITSTRPRYKRIPVLTDRINHYAMEHLTGIRVVRAYNAERFQEKKFEDASIDMMENSMAIWRRSSTLPAISSGMSNFLTLAIYWTGMVLIASSTDMSHQTVLFSDMIVFSSYAVQILGSFMALAFMIQFSARALASSKRVQEILAYEPCITDGDFEGPCPEEGTVEFRDVTFRYPGTDRDVIKNLSFKIGKGETMAVIGATGSGKSTIVSLLLRMYRPDSGEILVDGVEIGRYSQEYLNTRFGFVPQNHVLFTGDIEGNVNYGSTSSERTRDEIRKAVEAAQAAEFVDTLPEGISSEVTEGGRNLSGGQRQRVSIARALCRDAEILVLDDAFSALDMATDRRLRTALKKEYSGRSVLMVTQRVSTVTDADKVLVLEEGKTMGIGRHHELLETCPLYRSIAESQMAEGTV